MKAAKCRVENRNNFQKLMGKSLRKDEKLWRQKLIDLNAQQRFVLSLCVALPVFFLLARFQIAMRAVATWDVFTLCFLGMAAAVMFGATNKNIRGHANTQDSGRHFVFVFSLFAACVSLLAVIFLLKSAKETKGLELALHLGLAVLAVAGSWLMIHMAFAFRYAHMFYGEVESPDDNPDTDDRVGGLDFPKENEPDYVDFAYFSFVIGMTFQVSDVAVSARPMRRLTLLHSLLSFAFNTMILALSVNIVSGLL